jgi:hypothetical protein
MEDHMNGITERRAARFGGVLLTLGALTACGDILAVDLPSNLTDDVLSDPGAASTQIASVIHQFECGYSDYVWEIFGYEDGGQYVTVRGSGTHTYPTNAPGGTSCAEDPHGNAQYSNMHMSRMFAKNLHEQLGEWTVAQVADRARYLAITSMYQGAVLGWLGATMCENTIDGGPLLTPAQTNAEALKFLDQAITEIGTAGDFAMPYGIAPSARNMAHGLRAQVRWMAGDKAGAIADARLVPKGFVAYVTREAGAPGRMNTAYLGSLQIKLSMLAGVNDWWGGPTRPPNPATGQTWPAVIPFTGYVDLGILPNGRAIRDDGLPIRLSGPYRNADENTAIRDTRVKHQTLPIQAGPSGPVASRYLTDGDDIPLVNWKEMWLIRAEMEGGQAAIDLVNELRAADGLPAVTYITGATATADQIRYMVIEERRRALFLEGRYYLTKLKNLDVAWFPRGEGQTTASKWQLNGGVRRLMPQNEYELNKNLTLDSRATGCSAAERPVKYL